MVNEEKPKASNAADILETCDRIAERLTEIVKTLAVVTERQSTVLADHAAIVAGLAPVIEAAKVDRTRRAMEATAALGDRFDTQAINRIREVAELKEAVAEAKRQQEIKTQEIREYMRSIKDRLPAPAKAAPAKGKEAAKV